MRPSLQGIKVLDMTQYLSGPTVTRLMAELGADVVKIEQPPHGDPSRTLAVMRNGRSGYFVQQNRGKRSVCLDFNHPEGRKILDALIAECDVFVENYGPGVMERRGLDWATLGAKHPRLVMASISGFGKAPGVDPAYAKKTAFDLIAQSMSGFLHLTGPADGPPMPVGTSFADVSAGVHAFGGIAVALFDRERSGVGQHVDISMVDALFHAHELAVQGPFLTGGKWAPQRAGEKSALTAPAGVYRGPAGWVTLHVMQGQWPGFCRAMGQPDLATDKRFAGLREHQKNRHELNHIIEGWMATMPSDEAVLAALDGERVPCAPVFEPKDALGHPYFESRRAVRVVPDPVLGEIAIPGNPIRLSAQPDDLDLTAPLLGEHNAAVLRELGYSDAVIAELTSAGVLRSATV